MKVFDRPAAATCCLSLAAAVVLTSGLFAQGASSEVDRYLRDVARFPSADLAAFAAGQAISQSSTSASEGEIAVISAVQIHAAMKRVADYFYQFVMYEDGQVTLQVGQFSKPPRLEDVARLTVPDEDIKALRSCQPGNCDVKLSETGMTELQKAVDWNSPNAAETVNGLARTRLVDYVTHYLAQGDDALVVYSDKSTPVRLTDEWRGILRNSPNMLAYAPTLAQYLEHYPKARLAGSNDVFYWAKENYAGNVVIHADHMVLWRDPARADRLVIAQKQIYASHYYDGSLGLTTVVDTSVPGQPPSSTVVYFNRSRGDMLRGGLGVKRKVAESQAKKAAEETLSMLKTQLEKAGFPSAGRAPQR